MNKSILIPLRFCAFVISLLTLMVLVFNLTSADSAVQSRLLQQVQRLSAYDAANTTNPTSFGISIALQNDTAAVGAPEQDDYRGAVYVFDRTNGLWGEVHKLFRDDLGYGRGDDFGNSLALDGDTLLIGTNMESSGSSGKAYIFTREDDVWTEGQTLTSSDGQVHDRFGYSVAIQGDMALIGAPDHNVGAGTVYAFIRENGVWTEHQKIQLPNTPNPMLFGYQVQMDGEYAVISTRGETTDQAQAYIYKLVNGDWVQQQKLTETDFSIPRYYSPNVDIQGDRALVAMFNVRPGIEVFKRENDQWVSEQILYWGDFGTSVQIDGKTIVAGAPYAGNDDQGAAYVFRYVDGLWRQYAQPIPSDLGNSDHFGQAVAVDGSMVLVGSLHYTPQTGHGAVYVYNDPELVATETSLPPTATYTPGGPTITPEPTATNTPLPDGTVELLVNGGFELNTDSNQSPDGWKLKQESGDKLKCNDGEELIAFEGLCAFQFKGGDGENSKLQQDVDLVAHAVSTGDTLTLGGQIWAKGDVDSKVTLKVKYTTLSTDKVVVNVSRTGNATAKQWTAFSALQPNLSLNVAETPSEITLQIKHNSASGKVRYDALTLTHQSTTLLGLPQ